MKRRLHDKIDPDSRGKMEDRGSIRGQFPQLFALRNL
jgi:hypothetical protein